MKRLIPLFFLAAIALWAADFWTKPYTEWNEKDILKLMTDSPWAKKVSVPLTAASRGGAPGAGGGGGGGAKGGGRSSGPQGGGDADPGISGGGGGGIAESGGGGGRGGGRGGGGGGGGGDVGGGGGGGTPEINLIVLWRTALPVSQALVKKQYGSEAATSADAQKRLQPETKYYVIGVLGLAGSMHPLGEEGTKALVAATTLSAKDKDPIVPADVQFNGPARGNFDAYFLFPRSVMLTADDKEVDFTTKFGKSVVKAKFKLKDMVVNGKLDL